MTDESCADLRKDIEFLRDLQVTYGVAANGDWVCRVCGGSAAFANAIEHGQDCRLQKILGGVSR